MTEIGRALFAVRGQLETHATLHDLCGECGRQGSLLTGRSHSLAKLGEPFQHVQVVLRIAWTSQLR